MKKQFKLLLVASLSLTYVSCSTWTHTHRVSKIDNQNVAVTNEVAVDIRVDLTKIVRANSRNHSTVNQAKDEAMYLATRDNKIHVVVDPIFSVQSSRTLFGSVHSASVTGFAGYYVNPRSVKEVEDANYSKTQSADQAALESAILNFKTMVSVNKTVQTTTEEFINQNDCKDCPKGKAKSSTTSAQEFFKLIQSIK